MESDDRVKYFYKENGGIASARNFGLEQASGKYICFSDQDDSLKADMYEHLICDMIENFLKNYTDAIVERELFSEINKY